MFRITRRNRLRFALALPALIIVAVPALAQYDISGEWSMRLHEDAPERLGGPEIGDYLGLPINDAARLRADSWDASLLTLPEWQCRPHPADYGTRGPALMRIWKETDPETGVVIAYHTHLVWQAQYRTIWMDGRSHPPENAPHTWQGFSTGKWQGDVLTVYTTHLKEGYLRRNGVPRSDQGTLTEHYVRHGDYLTLLSIVTDPVYATEPLVRSTDWASDPAQILPPYPCDAQDEVLRPEGSVPHHLPGQNPFLSEFPQKYHLSAAAVRGGAATMYPEYAKNPGRQPASTAPTGLANAADAGVQVIAVRPNIYMISGAGANITVNIGRQGVLLVDAGAPGMSAKVLEEVRKLSPLPLRYIVNTSADVDHTGGNSKIGPAGITIAGGDEIGYDAKDFTLPWARIYAHANVLKRLSANAGESNSAFPSDVYHRNEKDIYFNDEAVRLLHPPAAHSDGDTMVFFGHSDVLSTGAIFVTTGYPVIDLSSGGSIQGEIDALNRIIDITVPADKEEGGTLVVPGRGRICDEADVAYYRDMITIIRDRIQDMTSRGMTLDQVKAARPTSDYDPRFGSDGGVWTTSMFVEAVYRDLERVKLQSRKRLP